MTTTLVSDFEIFWNLYPKKKAKLNAWRAYEKARTLYRATAESIIEGLAWQMHQDDWLREGGKFIPYPATWLNAGRWMDEPDSLPEELFHDWKCPHTPHCTGRNDCDVLIRLGR